MPYLPDFAAAERFLSKGRSKSSRPLANNTRLNRIDDDTIAVRHHGTDIVTFNRDGTFVLNLGGWNTTTTRARVNGFSPARVSRHPLELVHPRPRGRRRSNRSPR